MNIKKSNQVEQKFDPNKILKRITDQSKGLNVQVEEVFKKAIQGVIEGMSTKEIDNLVAISAADLIPEHPDYSLLASRIIITRQGKIIGVKPKDTDFLFDFFGIRSFFHKYSLRNDEGEPLELPHMMYDRVAKTFAKDKEEEKEFYSFLSNRKWTGATPILTNAGTVRKSYISCFVKDTQVLTNKGFKNIQDCIIGDEVITHTNNIKKITDVFKNERLGRDLYDLKVYGTPVITVTENHKFLSYNNKLKSLGKNPEFTELKNIRVGDYIKSVSDNSLRVSSEIIRISDYSNIIDKDWRTYKSTLITKIVDIETIETESDFQYNVTYEGSKNTQLIKKYHSFVKQFEITPELAKFIGLYYGDGNLVKTLEQGIQGINITCAAKAQNIVDFVKYISKKYFNIEPKIYNSKSKDGRTWIKCFIHSRILGILFKELFGHYFDQKKIYKGIYDWDKPLLDGLLAGIISSDGNVTKEGDVRFQIANPNLVKELFGVFKKNNYDVRLSIANQYRIKLNGEKRATQYRLDFGTNNELLKYITKSYDDNRLEIEYNKKQRFILKIGNDCFYKVQSIIKSDNVDTFVYDLEVENDHSYCVEGLIAHNCNLTTLIEDDTSSILSTLNDISFSSRDGAGIGLHIHKLRSEKSLVSSFKGTAGGVVRFADMVQSHMRFFKQGNRSGSAALYLGVWHRDILEFLSLRLPTGDEKLRTRDLFTAVCLPDIFMEKLKAGEELWYTFCPNEVIKAGKKPLHETWGAEFKTLYNEYVQLGLGHPIPIREIWDLLIRAQVEGGMPYTFFWDNANRHNPQKHLGVITGSNLCAEIVEVTRANYTAQCTLGSINLQTNLTLEDIADSARVLTRFLNRVIDLNQWSTEGARIAGLEQRALALGVSGMADYLAMNKINYEESAEQQEEIIKTIYNAAFTESHRLAVEEGIELPCWKDSVYDKGGCQHTLFYNNHKVANSLFIGLMPTASTSVLVGVNESFEPFESNLFIRKIDNGEFVMINKHLVRDLQELGLWNKQMVEDLKYYEGSVQQMDIPDEIKKRYKTVWEMKPRLVLDTAIARQKWVDQSQSLNMYYADPKSNTISTALIYAWEGGLKTGSYYTKVKSKLDKPKRLGQEQKTSTTISPGWTIDCFGCSA